MRFKIFALFDFVIKIFFLNKSSIIAKRSSHANNNNIIAILFCKFYLLKYRKCKLLKESKKFKKLFAKML